MHLDDGGWFSGDEDQTYVRGLTAKEAMFRLISGTTSNPATAAAFGEAAEKERQQTTDQAS